MAHCGGAETPATSARRKQESGAPRLKAFWKFTMPIIEGSFLYILNQKWDLFSRRQEWECTSSAKDWEGGGEGAVINLGRAQAATACCHTPSWGAQHLQRGDNASGKRTRARVNFEQNAWLAAKAREAEVLGIFCKNIKRINEGRRDKLYFQNYVYRIEWCWQIPCIF